MSLGERGFAFRKNCMHQHAEHEKEGGDGKTMLLSLDESVLHPYYVKERFEKTFKKRGIFFCTGAAPQRIQLSKNQTIPARSYTAP